MEPLNDYTLKLSPEDTRVMASNPSAEPQWLAAAAKVEPELVLANPLLLILCLSDPEAWASIASVAHRTIVMRMVKDALHILGSRVFKDLVLEWSVNEIRRLHDPSRMGTGARTELLTTGAYTGMALVNLMGSYAKYLDHPSCRPDGTLSGALALKRFIVSCNFNEHVNGFSL
jgi:hypothetical protein